MSVDEIRAWEWTCDLCKRKKVLPGQDSAPPDHWVEDGLFSFCCYSHHREWLKKIEEKERRG